MARGPLISVPAGKASNFSKYFPLRIYAARASHCCLGGLPSASTLECRIISALDEAA